MGDQFLDIGPSCSLRTPWQLASCHYKRPDLLTNESSSTRRKVLNTSASNPTTLAKILAAALALSVVGILMTASLRISSSASFPERIFENKIPSHIPLKIKIKKEKEESFKDLKNEQWLRGFELELTNTGDKPIYFVHIIMGTNVKVDDGLEMVYPLTYGRAQLGDIVSKATSDDSPIKPGETIVLQIREAPYWEKGVREGRWPQATKFTASIQVLSFGDGTGYFGTELYPPVGRPRAAAKDKKLPDLIALREVAEAGVTFCKVQVSRQDSQN